MLTVSQVNRGDTPQNMVLKIPACETTIQVSSPAVTQTQSLSVAEKKCPQLGYTSIWAVHRRYPVYFASALADVVILVVQVLFQSLDIGAYIGHVSLSLSLSLLQVTRKTAFVTQTTGECPQLGTPTLLQVTGIWGQQ